MDTLVHLSATGFSKVVAVRGQGRATSKLYSVFVFSLLGSYFNKRLEKKKASEKTLSILIVVEFIFVLSYIIFIVDLV